MNCPVCSGVALAMSNREGVEIDYCPQCRGVWLDRGELDKIIERNMKEYGDSPAAAAGGSPPPQPVFNQREQRPQQQERWNDDDDDDYNRQSHGGRRKRRSFLGDLFEFD